MTTFYAAGYDLSHRRGRLAYETALIGQPVAFDGAEGFGAYSLGGVDGTIYDVTNLNDDGAGSFREAVEASGPRIVTFSVSGLITLDSLLTIADPNISILGQTSPGTGITLTTDPASNSSCLWITTNDVIVRYLKIRPGPSTAPSTGRDALTIEAGAHDVIIDHCSLSWASDENASAYGAPGTAPYNITFQWCIISEGLYDDNHTGGPHSMGMLLSGDSYDISVHHCLFAHNYDRNPTVKTLGVCDFVNNVIYNYGLSALWSQSQFGDVNLNYVGNYVRQGLDSDVDRYEIVIAGVVAGNYSVYVDGNIGPHRTSNDQDQDLVVDPGDRAWVVEPRHNAPQVTTTSAFDALDQVLAGAGASQSRDAIDARVVADVIAGTGNIIDDPSDVGGW